VMAEEALKLEGIDPAAGEADAEVNDEEAPATEPQPSKDVAEPKISLPDSTLPEVWADPGSDNMADTPEQTQLLEDLSARRQELDAREKALQNKEALLQATEKQIDDKLKEMTELKDQIQKLLGQQNEEESSKIKSLVKIYEGMKAKAAAEIFNQMDMDILVQVVSQMSERKSAPVIAAMDVTKANQLTTRLSEMKQLPKAQAGNAFGGPVPTSAPQGSASLPGLDALGQPGTN